MSWGAIVVGGASAVIGAVQSGKNRRLAEQAANEASLEQQRQQEALDVQKAEYKAMQFKNPFENMENVFEDITVNQQQAEFQAQQGAQQRASIMQNMKGAAGASGIAGLATALASQGALQTQQISASIGQQEARNQMAIARGAASVQTAQRQGEQWVQQAEMDRQATLLGMQMGEATGANVALQQAQANQMNAQIGQQQMTMDILGTLGAAAGQIDFKGMFGPKQGK